MKKQDTSLFKIGEVTKILGITRKTLLVYEEAGLLTPAVKDEESGYRYYSADNMTQIRSIRTLQTLGLSLKEVAEYYYDTEKLDLHLQRMLDLRAALDRNIQKLQVRAASRGDLTVHRTSLPRQVCFCRRFEFRDAAKGSIDLRETYIAAARSGEMSMLAQLFTMRAPRADGKTEFICCISMEDSFDGPERVEFPAAQALCIYFRGPYEELGTAMQSLAEYVQEHNIETTGPIRSIYLEGPPSRGEKSEDYITQIAVPIRE